MSLSAIRTQIRAIVESVSGIGVVYDYERWAPDWKEFLALFKTTGDKINGWIITRRNTPAERDTVSTIQRNHAFILRGIYGLSDAAASEKTFQDQVEAVELALRGNYTLNNTVFGTDPVQVKIVENRIFGSVLCHYAELELVAMEIET